MYAHTFHLHVQVFSAVTGAYQRLSGGHERFEGRTSARDILVEAERDLLGPAGMISAPIKLLSKGVWLWEFHLAYTSCCIFMS